LEGNIKVELGDIFFLGTGIDSSVSFYVQWLALTNAAIKLRGLMKGGE
jgi:hypothetical protein